MKLTLLANLAAFALVAALAACNGLLRWELLLFQLVLQVLTNEFWTDLFMLPFKGMHLYGVEPNKVADPARVRRVSRWSCAFVLFFPALLLSALFCADFWSGGALAQALHLPPGAALATCSLAGQGLLFAASLAGGLVPLSYRSLIDALMARRERHLLKRGREPKAEKTPFTPPPTHAGVEMLPHGLPEGLQLPDCLAKPQCCSPLHAQHAELVREHLLPGERAILSTAPAGVVALPSSSNERFYGSILLCISALLLYTAIGLFEEGSSRIITRWVVLLLGLGLLPASLRVLRAATRRQALLRRTDYFITNTRVHMCRAGQWSAVPLASMEVLPGGEYGEGCADVILCPERGPDTLTLINVPHAQPLCGFLGVLTR